MFKQLWMLRIGICCILFTLTIAFLIPSLSSYAQSENAVRASQTCFAEVKWNYLANLRRGPSENYGVKRQLISGTEMRVFGHDGTETWWQVILPDPLNIIGWIWGDNVNLFGQCSALPNTSAVLEPDSAPSAPADVALPEFVESLKFTENDRIFYLNNGMIYIRYETEEPLVQAHIVIADLNAPQLEVGVEVGAIPNRSATPVSDMAKEAGAFVAINGDFYGGSYLPQGLTVVDNQVVTAPKFRATFAITEDKEPFMGYFTREWTWQGSVIAENGAFIPLQLANLPCNNEWMCLYTDIIGTMPNREGYDGRRVLLSPDYEVLSITDGGLLDIPKGHFVLRAGSQTEAGRWIRAHIKVGDMLEVYTTTEPAWQDFEHAISGGPFIVQEGEFWQDCDPEVPEEERFCEEFNDEFRNEHYFENHIPRSAVGYNPEIGALILIMVEGYEVTDSGGVTQRELADLFIRFGAEQAMEFDGGGSAGLWIDHGHVNDFGARGERRVSNALMLFWEE